MAVSGKKPFVRNNEALKASNVVENITPEEHAFRIAEMMKCREDPIYFAEKYFMLVEPGVGKHIITMYPKQKDMVRLMQTNDRVVVTASRQSGKTVSYGIYATWLTSFHKDKKILICAQRADSAREFLSRIKMAYEFLPSWLKPGVETWNEGNIEFSNGSEIFAIATSESAARGYSIDVLILDEFAHVLDDKAFWTGVYPVVSSNKGTKVIIVSTPRGTGNMFYEIWNRAELGIDPDGFVPFKIDWWDKPGRDDVWKRKQLASIGEQEFSQEFGNSFLTSSFTLVDGRKINEIKRELMTRNAKSDEHLIGGFDKFKLCVWHRPVQGHTYVIGGDVSEGIGGDYSVLLVFDISNTSNIKLAASFANNSIPTDEFSFVTNKVHRLYNNALISMECNSIGRAIFDSLQNNYDCDNFLTFGSRDPSKVGIFSHSKVKNFACMWLKNMMSLQEIRIELNDKHVVYEMEWFEKKKSGGINAGFSATSGKHDDYMMSFIWAMLPLNPTLVESYFQVEKYGTTAHGFTFPLIVRSADSGYYSEGDAEMPRGTTSRQEGLPGEEELMTTLDDDFSTKPRSLRALKKAEDLGPKEGEEDFKKLAFTSADADDPNAGWEDSGSW